MIVEDSYVVRLQLPVGGNANPFPLPGLYIEFVKHVTSYPLNGLFLEDSIRGILERKVTFY